MSKDGYNNKCVHSPLTKELMSYLQEKFINYWNNNWKLTCQASGKGLALLNVCVSIERNIPIYKLKNRQYERVMYRLRIGHVRLASYLHRIGCIDSALCSHWGDQTEETVQHYLLKCSAYDRQRACLVAKLKKKNVDNIDLNTILGGERKYHCCCIYIV